MEYAGLYVVLGAVVVAMGYLSVKRMRQRPRVRRTDEDELAARRRRARENVDAHYESDSHYWSR